MASPTAVAVLGSTGLIGSNVLTTLLALDSHKPIIHTITRRAPKPTSPALHSVVDADTTKWAATLSTLDPAPSTVFSALGTTRAAAGGLANQWRIDHDLNIELAKAAREAGVKTYVFISSAGSDGLFSAAMPYFKMKNGVEKAIKELGFDHAIVVRPGTILGEREGQRMLEGIAQSAIRGLGKVHGGLRDALGQEASVIAKAAVVAAQTAADGKAPSTFWVVEASEILKLGRATEST